jgi:hypothetical protein
MKQSGFQQMMTLWEQVHPVNAVQCAELSTSFDVGLLRSAVHRSLQKLEAAFSGGGWRLHFGSSDLAGGDVVETAVSSLNSDLDVEDFITGLMNHRFLDTHIPVRVGFFLQAETHVLWICYRHVVADARSIARLLQHIIEELTSEPGMDLPISLYRSESGSELLPIGHCQPGILSRIRLTLASLLKLQRCRRPSAPAKSLPRMQFRFHARDLPLECLKQQSKIHGSSVGELVSAAVLEWAGQRECSRTRPWATSVCVSVLADVASRATKGSESIFGQFICPFTIYAERRKSFPALVRDVGGQLRGEKNLRVALQNLEGLELNSFFLKLIPRCVGEFLQETLFPISAAVSNVNLNSMLPPSRYENLVTGYWRSTCATQFSPIIVCLTTCDRRCTLTSTHFTDVYDDDAVQNLGQHLKKRLFNFDPDSAGTTT